MLLNYHIGCIVLGLHSFSRRPGYHPSRTAPQLQHTATQEQYSQCGSSTTWSQTPEDGHINARNMLST